MFNLDEKKYNDDCEDYYLHLGNLDLQVRLKKLHDLFHDEKYQVKKIKLFSRYNEEFKHNYFNKKESIIELADGVDPYFSTLFTEDLFDIMEVTDFSDGVRESLNSYFELEKDEFPVFFNTDGVRESLNSYFELEKDEFPVFFNKLMFNLKIPDIVNLDFNIIEDPLIKRISFGEIKDIPYVIYDQKSFEEAELLSNKKQHFFYDYLSVSFFNLLTHLNDLVSHKENNVHFIFSKNDKGYKKLSNLVLKNGNGTQFIFQDLNENQNIFLSIIMQKTPEIINKENCEYFLSSLESGIKRMNPLSEKFEEKKYWMQIKTDLQRKLIINNLDGSLEDKKENKRRL